MIKDYLTRNKDKIVYGLIALFIVVITIVGGWFLNAYIQSGGKTLNAAKKTVTKELPPIEVKPVTPNIETDKVLNRFEEQIENPPKPPIQLPPIVFDTQFGVTEHEGYYIVSLFDLNKTTNGYRRYLTYSCRIEDDKPFLYNVGTYFVFGRDRLDKKYVPIEVISVLGDNYSANKIEHFDDILIAMNKAKTVSFSLSTGQSIILNIKNRKTDTLPCIHPEPQEASDAATY